MNHYIHKKKCAELNSRSLQGSAGLTHPFFHTDWLQSKIDLGTMPMVKIINTIKHDHAKQSLQQFPSIVMEYRCGGRTDWFRWNYAPQRKNSTSVFLKNSIYEILATKLDVRSSSWSYILFSEENLAVTALALLHCVNLSTAQSERAWAFVLAQLHKHLTLHLPQTYVRRKLRNPSLGMGGWGGVRPYWKLSKAVGGPRPPRAPLHGAYPEGGGRRRSEPLAVVLQDAGRRCGSGIRSPPAVLLSAGSWPVWQLVLS